MRKTETLHCCFIFPLFFFQENCWRICVRNVHCHGMLCEEEEKNTWRTFSDCNYCAFDLVFGSHLLLYLYFCLTFKIFSFYRKLIWIVAIFFSCNYVVVVFLILWCYFWDSFLVYLSSVYWFFSSISNLLTLRRINSSRFFASSKLNSYQYFILY